MNLWKGLILENRIATNGKKHFLLTCYWLGIQRSCSATHTNVHMHVFVCICSCSVTWGLELQAGWKKKKLVQSESSTTGLQHPEENPKSSRDGRRNSHTGTIPVPGPVPQPSFSEDAAAWRCSLKMTEPTLQTLIRPDLGTGRATFHDILHQRKSCDLWEPQLAIWKQGLVWEFEAWVII